MELMTFLKHQQHIVTKIIIWIMFQNFKIGTLTTEKYNHYYNNNIESKWTPIEPTIKYIRVGIYHNKDSISNSTYNNKNHPSFSRIITRRIGF
jgi:hypothetical protein